MSICSSNGRGRKEKEGDGGEREKGESGKERVGMEAEELAPKHKNLTPPMLTHLSNGKVSFTTIYHTNFITSPAKD
jgi:hypothetical protein